MENITTYGAHVLAALSNLFFIFPIIAAFYEEFFMEVWIYSLMMVISLLYHLCDSFTICIFDSRTITSFDFFFAQYLVIITFTYFIYFP